MSRPATLRERLARTLWLLALLAGSALAAPAASDMARRTQACTFCHGKQGRAGPDGYYPRLAGKPAGYLYNQLRNFRDGRRHYGLMTGMVDMLSDDYLMEIARYFAAMDVPYPPPAPLANRPAQAVLDRGRELVRQGDASVRLPACVQCHGDRLTGAQPDVPGLLGLPLDYLVAQLGGWRNGERRSLEPDCMASVVRRMADADVYAVVSWLASQPLPANTHPEPSRPPVPADAPDLKCGSAAAPLEARP